MLRPMRSLTLFRYVAPPFSLALLSNVVDPLCSDVVTVCS